MEVVDEQTPSLAGEKQELKQIVVMLMGLPGSGKSTFCDHVIRSSSRACERICQDTINNGKSGTKPQCLSAAASALNNGKSIFIDRCNISKDQRADFLNLGGPKVEKHAVVLDLPAKLCISRSVKRTGHEGNLQGGRAAAVVNQMAQKKELPKLTEGFARVTFCYDEKDIKEAINVYGSLGPSDSLPSGSFGQKKSDTKTQLGIMKFLEKIDQPKNNVSEPPVSENPISSEITQEKQTKKDSDPSIDTHMELEEGDKLDITSISGDNITTLAFSSISTADFQFNLEKASDIIVEKVEEFVPRIGKARLVLVDLSHGSKILNLVKTKAEKKKIDPNKFFTFVGDITQLRSQKGLHCNVIANATNWRLKPRGEGVNAAIFKAAGSALEIATKEKADCLKPGQAVVVPLPPSSPFFTKEGVTHVIHVLGPNMNPMRPDCLKDDYAQGCKLLHEAYSSLFEGFLSIVRSDDQKLKREVVHESDDKNKKHKGIQEEFKVGESSSVDGKNVEEKKGSGRTSKEWGSWAQVLYNIAMNPEKHMNAVLEVLDDIVVLNDAYPKAQRHILVLARAKGLDSIADVRREHVSLLKMMHDVGLKWTENFFSENRSLVFRFGYHSVPSMRQLHLHVISQDFESSHLKNKKHWNSFNTPFFLDSVDVIKELDDVGIVSLNNDKFLSMELRCNRCRSAHPNIPRLKSHISSCKASLPAALLENGRLIFSEGNDN